MYYAYQDLSLIKLTNDDVQTKQNKLEKVQLEL
jgi:hypothetical protein